MDDEKDMMDDDEQTYSSFFNSDDGDGDEQQQVQVAVRPSASSTVLEAVEPVAAVAVGDRPPFTNATTTNGTTIGGGGYNTGDHHGGVDQPSNPPFGVNAAATMASSPSINATTMLQEAASLPSDNNNKP